eukprot:4575835-Amphidinium_carterae.1
MSTIGPRALTRVEAALLLECGSFWPDSMVEQSSFVKMLLHILKLEVQPDIQASRWEEELAASRWEEEITASGACNASGVVDVKHFVSREMWKSIGRVAILRVLAKSKVEDTLLAATRFVVSHGAEWQPPAPSEPSRAMRVGINTNQRSPSIPSGGDMSSSDWSLSLAVFGEQIPLPSPEDQA